MCNLTKEDYMDILKGGGVGRHFSGNYFTIQRKAKDKPTEKQILTNGNVGLPRTLNEEYSNPKISQKSKKRKVASVDPDILRFINN